MSTIATGVFKKVSYKKQTGQGTKAPAGAAGTARYTRRTSSTLDLSKAVYGSAEILESQQKRDSRHGVRAVAGSIAGELSVGGYQLPMESVCRRLSTAGIAAAAVTTIAAAFTTDTRGTFTRSAGSFLTDGFNIGDVVQWSGFTAAGVPNNAHNMVIIALTALVMTVSTIDGTPVVTKAAGDSVIGTVVGRITYMPPNNQTRDYYTINHWFSDIAQSEEFIDCVFTGFTINLPPSGMATIELPVMGLDMQTGTVEYFLNPAAAATGGNLAAVNGELILNGVPAGTITGMTIVVNGNYTVPGGVVGSNVNPDVFPGSIDVTGQITVLFNSVAMRDAFLNETEGQIAVTLTANNTPNAPFTAFSMSRVKFNGATKDDSPQGLTLTVPYVALENVNTSGAGFPNRQTTLSVQDSSWA